MYSCLISEQLEEYDGTTWTTTPGSINTARGWFRRSRYESLALYFGGETPPSLYSSNRRMDRCRSSSNKNNYSKLTGGKYGTYKNIHRS
jgi:hypothetical protein